ncbi:UdgX family uracil-DNA binding protein [Cognatishimia sp. F0-27]|uniref:UdgX family uracil-DNA binding protein n=1 Tax=Cognatishimia sp. F0-27 TaxID=2816855 RepID=UPI001D0CD880|nr:UdgX family uracil-DNA binding protein [Cognatishimia sp. F0-27]MCC1493051.1 UdgX family uracil-DNA binding protein [Cognatishimia sp. F0-27]
MIAVRLPRTGLWPAFRDTARRLLGARITPDMIDWDVEGVPTGLFADPVPDAKGAAMTLKRSLAGLLTDLTAVRGPEGLSLAYRLLWRAHTGRLALEDRADPDIARARVLAKSVHRDLHKMHAFVRFKEVTPHGTRRRFTAWFEPDHRIEDAAAPFFAKRFGDMDWIIRTPEVTISFTQGVTRITSQINTREITDDALEALWCSYYSHIFNPARLKVAAMTSEMPRKYWRNLPEAGLIPGLIAEASARRDAMISQGALPASREAAVTSLDALPAALAACERCTIGCHATRAVTGSGPANAPLMIVGEQPGDVEDRAGVPFVGPAGAVLDTALQEADIGRDGVYLTNAVKHFKFTRRGTRRIHQRPDRSEVEACRWWLDHERTFVKPRLIIALGATAALALTGNGNRIRDRRGTIECDSDGRPVLLTVHPSSILRQPDPASRIYEARRFAADLRNAREFLAKTGAPPVQSISPV